jgi:hypothetical protein
MKRESLKHHKEATLVCGEGISEIEVICSLLIPQNSKTILA